MPHAAWIKPSGERLAHLKEKWQRRAEEFALVVFQCLPETDTGMNVFGKLDEHNGQFVERIVVELVPRVDERFLRFRNHSTQSQSEAGKPLVQSTGSYGGTVGFEPCFEIILSAHFSINSCSSSLERIHGLDLILHGALVFYPVKVL